MRPSFRILTMQNALRFPAIAFFQRQDALQADVHTSELKCSSGPRHDNAIQCSSLTIEEALKTESCDCGDSWPGLEHLMRNENEMIWLAQNTSCYAMVPGLSTISQGVGHFLEIQLFFSCKEYTTSAVLNRIFEHSQTTQPRHMLQLHSHLRPESGWQSMIRNPTSSK
jgi:hypothetical protein